MDPNLIPIDYPVQPLKANDHAKDRATCGHCGLSWDDGVSTQLTPRVKWRGDDALGLELTVAGADALKHAQGVV